MKNTLLFLFFFFIGISAIAQDDIKSFVQHKATPKEGLKTFYQNFVQEFVSPDLPKNINEVTIRLKFVVEKDGSFSNIQILDDKQGVGNEAVRVLKLMPEWNPAQHQGNVVRSSFTLPIKIRVRDAKKESEELVYTTEDSIKAFMNSLEANSVETNYFEFRCDCALVRSTINDELQTEEFMLQSRDESAYYNIVFRKVTPEQGNEELRAIENDAMNQNAKVQTVLFNHQKATEIAFSMPDGDYINHYRTIFQIKNDYLMAVTIVSYKEQIADLLMQHFKQSYKLKI
ncbi:MAG TPA: hypothetical protein VLY87_00275 [Flavobacterium sp.]|nr:hypothetical protein [Flavobacterium sp.]